MKNRHQTVSDFQLRCTSVTWQTTVALRSVGGLLARPDVNTN